MCYCQIDLYKLRLEFGNRYLVKTHKIPQFMWFNYNDIKLITEVFVIIINIRSLVMSKTPFSKEKALKSAIVSNQIEGYAPVKDKEVLKKVKEYLSLIK